MILIDGKQALYSAPDLEQFRDQFQPPDQYPESPTFSDDDGRWEHAGKWDQPVTAPDINYPPFHHPKLNQLVWPTGATRWAYGHFLVNDSILSDVASKIASTTPLRLTISGVPFRVFALAPRQMTAVSGNKKAWVLPVVDQRYFWQFRHVNPTLSDLETWPALILKIGESLNQTFVPGVVDGSYLAPDPVELFRPRMNAARLLDIVAHSTGRRVVVTRTGSVALLGALGTEQVLAARHTPIHAPGPVIAGGAYTRSARTTGVRMVFRSKKCREQVRDWTYERNVGTDTRGVVTVHSTAWADFAADATAESDPLNKSTLDALADKWATDWLSMSSRHIDVTYIGIPSLSPSGADDCIIYTVDDAQDSEERRVTTRVIGLPENFAPNTQLSQTVNPLEPDAFRRFVLRESLEPCTSALAEVVRHEDGQTCPVNCFFEVHDALGVVEQWAKLHDRNPKVPQGTFGLAKYYEDADRYEVCIFGDLFGCCDSESSSEEESSSEDSSSEEPPEPCPDIEMLETDCVNGELFQRVVVLIIDENGCLDKTPGTWEKIGCCDCGDESSSEEESSSEGGCESCMEHGAAEFDDPGQDFDIGATAISYSPNPVCTGEEFTLEVDVKNNEAFAWDPCPENGSNPCAMYFGLIPDGDAGFDVEIISSDPPLDRLTSPLTNADPEGEWDFSLAAGSTTTFKVTMRFNACWGTASPPAGTIETTVGRGYRSVIPIECVDCPQSSSGAVGGGVM